MLNHRRPEMLVAVLLLCAGLVIAATAAVGQGASPHAFLEQIYKVYRNNNSSNISKSNSSSNNTSSSKGTDYSRPDVIRRTFAPPLAKAMLKDQADAKKKQEAPRLNGDPLIDAQDWDIANLAIEVHQADRRHATGTVTFTNAREPRTVSLDLIKTGDGWRIAEIRAPSGSLKELYRVK